MQQITISLVASLEHTNNSVKITRLIATAELCTLSARTVQQVYDKSQQTFAGRGKESSYKKYLYESLLSVNLLYLELGVT